jgi:ribonuclease R
MPPHNDRNDRLRDEVLSLLRAKGAHPMSLRDIQHLLKVPPGAKRDLQSLLRRLCESGDLVRTRGKRFGVSAEMNLAPGRLQMHPDGYGFVVLDEKQNGDVFVKARELGGAMHADRVLVRIEQEIPGGRGPEGSIVRVLTRARASVVGRIERTGEYAYLTPADPRLAQDVFIPDGRVGEAKTGQMVVAEITAWPAARRPAEATVVEVLGDEGAPGVAEEVIIRQFDLPHRFPRRVLADAEGVPATVGAPERAGRVDLRGLLTVTIDGETARDFDDAISLEQTPKGTWLLRVHIADVSHYVPEGGAMDREAFARGTSVYFPGRVLPMLPERLSNGICSLNPGVDRLAFTAVLEFSRQGKLLKHDFLETVIHSDARLTYTAVARALEGGEPSAVPEVPGLAAMLAQARDLALAIRAQRAQRGSIDFDLPEEQILLDLQGSITTIVRSERNVAHRIIEEFMIAANEAVAGYFGWMKVPGIYRVHEVPSQEKLGAFAEFAAGFGHKLRLPLEPTSRFFADFIETLRGRPEERVLNEVLLRSMKQAVYSADNIGHFGLASAAYTHFTSPIRRYPDLVVHRLLRDLVRRGRFTPAQADELDAALPEIAAHCSARERVATEAEREVVNLHKTEYLARRVGETAAGFITGVTHFGLFVQLADVPVEGLVHVSTLGDDYYKHREDLRALVGTNTGTTFRHGDAVTVKIAAVDTALRRADFILVRERAAGAKDAPDAVASRRHGRQARGARAAGPKPRPTAAAKPEAAAKPKSGGRSRSRSRRSR